MKRLQPAIALTISSLLLLGLAPAAVLAANSTPPSLAAPAGLSFAEIKMTGDEFLVLQNNSGSTIPDLSNYWLDDFNNVSPLSSGVSSSTQQLPSASLGAGQTLLLSANPMPTCGAALAGKLSLSLTDSGGFLELVQMGQTANGAVTQAPGDVVSWSSGANGFIQSVPSSTKDPKAMYYRYLSGNSFVWQQADVDSTISCQLDVVVAGGSVPQSDAITPLASAASSPPATILSLASDGSAGATPASLPTADIGLMAPQISELLPNPVGTGNDATDEFVELYNPNPVAFDLNGFILETGLTGSHSYIFPSGASLAPKSFQAFYSADTGLNLSNTSGQARLLDPFGTIINSTDAYGTAKDGYAWALAKGRWYWTTNPTPAAANIIKQPTVTKKTSSKKTSSKKSTAIKGASTTSDISSSSSSASDTVPSTPIHVWVLALVAMAALLYGAYEYRVDLANRIYKLRSHWQARRQPRG